MGVVGLKSWLPHPLPASPSKGEVQVGGEESMCPPPSANVTTPLMARSG